MRRTTVGRRRRAGGRRRWGFRRRWLVIFFIAERVLGFLEHARSLLRDANLSLRQLLAQPRNPLQAGLVAILGPAVEQLPALLPDLWIREVGRAAHAQALQQRLVGKGAREARAGVLDEAVEQDQGADLAVHVAVLELLSNGAGGLRGAGGLDGDDLDEVGDAAEVFCFVGLGGEPLDGDRDGRIWLLL